MSSDESSDGESADSLFTSVPRRRLVGGVLVTALVVIFVVGMGLVVNPLSLADQPDQPSDDSTGQTQDPSSTTSPDTNRSNTEDNDVLPAQYERNVTGTDPTDSDSNSSETGRDESGNGISDAMEDFDHDTLSTYQEYTLGTDPFENDTDHDSIDDGFEYQQTEFDPLDNDTDGDGVLDGEADTDGDGLRDAEEYELGTAVDMNDTDLDELADAREVELGTNPRHPNTDEDAFSDSLELRLGSDPTDTDTDGDGVPDGDEIYETETTHNQTNVTVTIRGSGALVDEIRITEKQRYFSGLDVDVGPVVRIVPRTNFVNATVTIPINESYPPANYTNLSVFTWDGSPGGIWSPVEITRISNGTASATVESFGYFTVLDTPRWLAAIRNNPG